MTLLISMKLLAASGYSHQLSTHPLSVHVTIKSTIPLLALISIAIALVISIIVFGTSVKSLKDLFPAEVN